jgi:peptide/nickel transport system permease protein
MTTLDINAKGGPRVPRDSVTGVELAQGIGVREAKGFWTEAWMQVLRRPGAIAGITWISIVVFFAIFAPVLASGHPLILRELDESGSVRRVTFPLFTFLRPADVLLLLGGVLGPLFMLLPMPVKRSQRGGILAAAFVQCTLIVVGGMIIGGLTGGPHVSDFVRELRAKPYFVPGSAAIIGLLLSLPFLAIPMTRTFTARIAIVALVGVVAASTVAAKWHRPLERFDYRQREAMGTAKATYTLVPFSPTQASMAWFLKEPGTTIAEAESRPDGPQARFIMGSDVLGQDVLSQMLHASRLSISIGLVSTGIAVLIGVTIGALMGYFGGWVDLMLFRVVEVFMAIPVLFLLIVAAAVLPRNTYVMMAIIGCVTWTGSARFVRAEFYKLRNQDFVQAARAVSLPLRSILFKHMLPNGVTPVLVDASFAIAAAILAESVLSYLGLGPPGQPSWGRLLSGATSEVGAFVWWLAIFPGFGIFLTVLSYNLIGEALRDAIDPKLKKARV